MMQALNTTDVVEFVAISDPQVAPLSEEQAEAYMDDPDLSKLPLVGETSPTVWKIRPLSKREISQLWQWVERDEEDKPVLSPWWFGSHCIYGVVGVENLPSGVSVPTYQEVGLERRLSKEWLRNYPYSDVIDEVGLAIFKMSHPKETVRKNS